MTIGTVILREVEGSGDRLSLTARKTPYESDSGSRFWPGADRSGHL